MQQDLRAAQWKLNQAAMEVTGLVEVLPVQFDMDADIVDAAIDDLERFLWETNRQLRDRIDEIGRLKVHRR